ncbi:MAG: hypothetical protein Q8903_10185 [Bacteroidota bacterium]|nr:hypothetical protein [Bacteroidota bacterium]
MELNKNLGEYNKENVGKAVSGQKVLGRNEKIFYNDELVGIEFPKGWDLFKISNNLTDNRLPIAYSVFIPFDKEGPILMVNVRCAQEGESLEDAVSKRKRIMKRSEQDYEKGFKIVDINFDESQETKLDKNNAMAWGCNIKTGQESIINDINHKEVITVKDGKVYCVIYATRTEIKEKHDGVYTEFIENLKIK